MNIIFTHAKCEKGNRWQIMRLEVMTINKDTNVLSASALDNFTNINGKNYNLAVNVQLSEDDISQLLALYPNHFSEEIGQYVIDGDLVIDLIEEKLVKVQNNGVHDYVAKGYVVA